MTAKINVKIVQTIVMKFRAFQTYFSDDFKKFPTLSGLLLTILFLLLSPEKSDYSAV